jgi:preprotein translocase SecE subunit
MKRMSQRRAGTVEEEDPAAFVPPVTEPRRPVGPQLTVPGRIVEFGREVRSELRQVAWPTRQEVANSAMVVIIVLVLLGTLIFLLNYAFTHAILKLLSV